eukprot:333661_1
MEYRSFGGTSGKPFTIRFQMSNVFHRRKNSSLWRKLYLNNRHIDLCLILEWILQITEPIDQWIVSQGEVTRWIQSLSEGTAVNTSEQTGFDIESHVGSLSTIALENQTGPTRSRTSDTRMQLN